MVQDLRMRNYPVRFLPEKMTLLSLTMQEGGLTMDARSYLLQIDTIARQKGLTQKEFCRRAGLDEDGKGVSRAFFRGDCKLSTFLQMTRALGLELVLKKEEDE